MDESADAAFHESGAGCRSCFDRADDAAGSRRRGVVRWHHRRSQALAGLPDPERPDDAGLGCIFRAGVDMPNGETAANRGDIEVMFDGLPEPIDLELDDERGVLY